MPAPLIYAGQTLAATTRQGGLNQYYGLADTNPTTFTSAAQGNLCTPYVIPAFEPYAGAAYELSCSGTGQQGSTAQTLSFQMFLGSAFASVPVIGSVVFSVSQFFVYSLTMRFTCADGVSAWWAGLSGEVAENGATLIPGAAGQQSVAIAAAHSGSHIAAVSGALTAVIQAQWGATAGGPVITNNRTTFRKVA